MADVVGHSARQFGRAVIMPNLRPAIRTTAAALEYRERILDAVARSHDLPRGCRFEPLMTLYLTEETPPSEIECACSSGAILGAKLYPAGATTTSAEGVGDIRRIWPVLEAMQACGMPLLIHGEVTDPEVDIFDREQVFIERVLEPLRHRLPELTVVLEHITTSVAVELVLAAPERLAATITVHHLLLNRNAIFTAGLRPHAYCLPVLKREQHRRALVQAATSGDPRFFLGTDSAPHPRRAKETACGCAGIFSAHAALPLLAQVFEEAGALDRLEAFAAHRGADFYGLPRGDGQLELGRVPWQVPTSYPFGDDEVIPLAAGEILKWKVLDQGSTQK